jgi:transcriptional repressor of dcmA and dcmR
LGKPLSSHEIADSNELLDIAQAAALLNVSETSLRRWTNSGRLACLRVGRRRERRFRRGDLLAFLEGHGPDISPITDAAAHGDIADPIEGAVTLTLGSHLCGLYASDIGCVTLAVPFLQAGLNEGSICFLGGPVGTRRRILDSLGKQRPSLQADVDAGRIIESDYHAEARAQTNYWRQVFDEQIAGGAESFRIVGDVWGMRLQATEAVVGEYEADFDRLIARNYPVRTLCTYDVRKFSGVEVLNALKGHRDIFRHPLERALA